MFAEWYPIQVYIYLELVFGSLGLGLFISMFGIEPIKILLKEMVRNVK